MDLTDKICLVTGGAQGIGLAHTENLLKNGAKVAVCDINDVKGTEVSRQLNAKYGDGKTVFIKCDVTDENEFDGAFQRTIETFGGIDVVVNNAGVFQETADKWEMAIDINFKGVVRGTMLALKYMGKPNGGRGGTVVQMCSTAAFIGVTAPLYVSTKRAVYEYSRCIGSEYFTEHFGVRSIALCPGYTDTPFINGRQHMVKELEPALKKEKVQEYCSLQTPDNVGAALVHVLRNGKSGEAWIVENGLAPRLADMPPNSY